MNKMPTLEYDTPTVDPLLKIKKTQKLLDRTSALLAMSGLTIVGLNYFGGISIPSNLIGIFSTSMIMLTSTCLGADFCLFIGIKTAEKYQRALQTAVNEHPDLAIFLKRKHQLNIPVESEKDTSEISQV